MNASLPNHIVYQGRGLNLAGPGRAPGSHAFVDPGSGACYDLFFAEVQQAGVRFALTRIANNPGMSSALVRVDNALLNGGGPFAVGQVLLVGPLMPDTAGPRALGAWPVEGNVGQQRSHEKVGAITNVCAGFGFITPSDGGPNVFYHRTALANGLLPFAGLKVKYTSGQGPNGKGPAALSVRAA